MKIAGNICLLGLIVLCTGCVARTYGLNEEQQIIAEEKYALSPGLNLVDGEPWWNTSKVLARCILAPITLGISELALREDREYPYQKYSKELTQSAIQQVSKKYPNYHAVVDIFFAYCNIDPEFYKMFRDCAQEMGYVDTQKEYWELMYVSGTSIVQTHMKDVFRVSNGSQFTKSYDALEYCASNSNEVKKSLSLIRESLNQHSSRSNYGDLSITTNTYGLGTHADQYGRPVKFEVIGQPNADTSLLNVTPNAYGLGVHQDQFGRPVQATPGW